MSRHAAAGIAGDCLRLTPPEPRTQPQIAPCGEQDRGGYQRQQGVARRQRQPFAREWLGCCIRPLDHVDDQARTLGNVAIHPCAFPFVSLPGVEWPRHQLAEVDERLISDQLNVSRVESGLDKNRPRTRRPGR